MLPRLLCIDQVHVDLSMVLKCLFDSGLGDFVKHHPPHAIGVNLSGLEQVPRDRLALAVRVGRQEDLFCLLRLRS